MSFIDEYNLMMGIPVDPMMARQGMWGGIQSNANKRHEDALKRQAIASYRAPAVGVAPQGIATTAGQMGQGDQQQAPGGGIGDTLDALKSGKSAYDKLFGNTPGLDENGFISSHPSDPSMIDPFNSYTGPAPGSPQGWVDPTTGFIEGPASPAIPGGSAGDLGGMAGLHALPGNYGTLISAGVAPQTAALLAGSLGGSTPLASGAAAAGLVDAAAGGTAFGAGGGAAAGGAGAGLAAAAPLAIGGLAAYIAFNEIFGGKPSDRTGVGTVNLGTGQLGEFGGMQGKRSSKNEEAARQLAQYLGQSAMAQGGLEGDVRVRVGDRDGIRLQLGDGPIRWLQSGGPAGEFGINPTISRLTTDADFFNSFFRGGDLPEYTYNYWNPKQIEYRDMTGKGYRHNLPSADQGGPATWEATANTTVGAAHPTQSGKVFESWTPGYETSGASQAAAPVWGYAATPEGEAARLRDKTAQLWAMSSA